MEFKVKFEHTISDDKIANMLVSAFEGGSNYWCRIDKFNKPPGTPFKFKGDTEIYRHASYPVSEGGSLLIKDTTDGKNYTLDNETIVNGLKIMATKYPKHFADFLNDNDDADTGDVFLQCCLLKDVKYG